MLTNVTDLRKALKRDVFTGVILYEGPSMLDGAPIVVIANRIVTASDNEKTGAMVQTFIIRSDVEPMEALRSGDDASICGDCPHRPANDGTCYVNVGRSVRSVYGAFQRGRYARPGIDFAASLIPDLFAGSIFRLGTYGDPAAAPFQVWRAATLKVAACNGYSHQWRNAKFAAFRLLAMASCDNEQDRIDAKARGWRTFRVRHSDAPARDREVICPASHEAGKRTTCASCKACGGTSAKARADIVIMAHGATANRFAA